MLVEKLETIADGLGWAFAYGDDAELNMTEFEHQDASTLFEERKKFLGLDPVIEDDQLNKYNGTDSTTYSGFVVLMVSSLFNQEEYLVIYKDRIKQLKELTETLKTELIGCQELTISRWRKTEVINRYDENMDGIKIEFTIKIFNR